MKAVLVAGMHRSGTSLVAGLLQFLGVKLGPESLLMGPAESNRKGHFEFSRFVELNEEILALFGGRWEDPPKFPAGWESSSRVQPIASRARALLDQHFRHVDCWGFKDPRNCLTLPFWKTVIDRPIKCILVSRNPLDVALSLRSRNGISIGAGAILWKRYMTAALEGCGVMPAVAMFLYDDLLDRFDAEFARLAAFLEVPPERSPEAKVFAARELRHHRSSIVDLKACSEIGTATKALYETMVQGAAQARDRV